MVNPLCETTTVDCICMGCCSALTSRLIFYWTFFFFLRRNPRAKHDRLGSLPRSQSAKDTLRGRLLFCRAGKTRTTYTYRLCMYTYVYLYLGGCYGIVRVMWTRKCAGDQQKCRKTGREKRCEPRYLFRSEEKSETRKTTIMRNATEYARWRYIIIITAADTDNILLFLFNSVSYIVNPREITRGGRLSRILCEFWLRFWICFSIQNKVLGVLNCLIYREILTINKSKTISM